MCFSFRKKSYFLNKESQPVWLLLKLHSKVNFPRTCTYSEYSSIPTSRHVLASHLPFGLLQTRQDVSLLLPVIQTFSLQLLSLGQQSRHLLLEPPFVLGQTGYLGLQGSLGTLSTTGNLQMKMQALNISTLGRPSVWLDKLITYADTLSYESLEHV